MNNSRSVVFKNEPREFNHESDLKFNERRKRLIPKIKEFVSEDNFFNSPEISIEFAHTGVSSLVCFIEFNQKKYVLKIPLALSPLEGEALFLRIWESVGVTVPHVYLEGKIEEFPYILMSFIDAPLLSQRKKEDEISVEVYVEMGKLLRKMHLAKTSGFGHMKNGKSQFSTFKDWLTDEDIQRRIRSVIEQSVMGDDCGNITDVQNILLKYCENDNLSTYCHFDFGTSNLLATDPPSVIDPFPLFNNCIIDIGRTIQLMSSGSSPEKCIEEFKSGYFPQGVPDNKALQASIVLSAYLKFYHWKRANKLEAIENTKKYLLRTRYLLD